MSDFLTSHPDLIWALAYPLLTAVVNLLFKDLDEKYPRVAEFIKATGFDTHRALAAIKPKEPLEGKEAPKE